MDVVMMDKTKCVMKKERDFVEKILNFAADYFELPAETEISVTFMNDAQIQVVNRKYRGKDSPTDVISFALQDERDDELAIIFEKGMIGELPQNLGDMMISIERAKEQAEEYGHSYERELGFLVIHGFLHLNGYDHQNSAEEKEMFHLQGEILGTYGLTRE
ncbi:MAG: rRNA maturation RNase YbeY [Lactobacillales bacterium]|nr:rRNA maturation RNase YbeY [Lactobacillales bacterium]